MSERDPAATIASPSTAPISKPGVFHAEVRSRQVLVRLTPAEYDELAAVAAEHHLSMPDLLRAGWRFLKNADDNARRTA